MKHKTNKAKHRDHGCRNNGPCGECTGNRTHAARSQEPVDDEGEEPIGMFDEFDDWDDPWPGPDAVAR